MTEEAARQLVAGPAPGAPAELSWDEVRPVDALGLEVGFRLIPLVDKGQGGDLMARIKAIRRKQTQDLGFLVPAVHIREGSRAEELVKLVNEDPSISLVVLATATGSSNPGPVVSYLLANLRRLPVPVTLVPGELTPEQIDRVT